MSTLTLTPPKNEECPPFPVLEKGTIMTLFRPGHTQTAGQEYYCPVLVLEQYANNDGSIDAMVWDSTSGTSYIHNHPIRETSVREVEGSNQRVKTLVRDHIGSILFSPSAFAEAQAELSQVKDLLLTLQTQVLDLQSAVTNPPKHSK
jgi:hypothetical protein